MNHFSISYGILMCQNWINVSNYIYHYNKCVRVTMNKSLIQSNICTCELTVSSVMKHSSFVRLHPGMGRNGRTSRVSYSLSTYLRKSVEQ